MAARPPAPDHDPARPIRRLFDPSETQDMPRLHLSPADPDSLADEEFLTLVLDGAALPALPDRLDGRGVARACLFDGASAEELGDAAPWRAQLPLSNPLAREAIAGRALLGFVGPQTLSAVGRLCCTNRVRDSSRESSVVAGMHEQTDTADLQDQELASL